MRLDRKSLRSLLFEEVVELSSEEGSIVDIDASEPLGAMAPGVPRAILDAAKALADFAAPGNIIQWKRQLKSEYPDDIGDLSAEQVIVSLRNWLGSVVVD